MKSLPGAETNSELAGEVRNVSEASRDAQPISSRGLVSRDHERVVRDVVHRHIELVLAPLVRHPRIDTFLPVRDQGEVREAGDHVVIGSDDGYAALDRPALPLP